MSYSLKPSACKINKFTVYKKSTNNSTNQQKTVSTIRTFKKDTKTFCKVAKNKRL